MQNIFSPNSSSDRVFLTLLPGGLGDPELIGGCAGHMGLPGMGGWTTTPTRISRRTTTHISWVQNIRTTMRATVKTGQQI